MTKSIYTVYKITNNINNKIYIGVHKTTNPNDSYVGSGTIITSSIKKYGKDNFTKSIQFEYDNPKEAYLIEFLLVDKDFIKRPDTYNISPGGCGGNTGYYTSGTDHHWYGKTHSIETKNKISNSNTGKINQYKGIKLSQETKNKISNSKIGKKNYRFSGYYITPWGKFESLRLIPNHTNIKSLLKWCKNSHKIITQQTITPSKYLQSLKESPLGKTFNDIGFSYLPIDDL